jgi:HrpA-like RNA helicase
MDRKVTDDTRVVYMTTGVLLQHLINKKNLTDYTHIICIIWVYGLVPY